MESVLEFIRVNYIWLLVIAVIILFALVGYIAEKQGFTGITSNKEKNKKMKKDTKKSKDVVEEIPNETIPTEELTFDEADLNDVVAEEELEEIVETIDSETESLEQIDEEILDKKEDLNIDQDFNQVLEDVEETSNEANIELPKEDIIELEEEDIWKF